MFGMRLGFRDAETALFRQKSKTLAGVAAYSWHNASVSLDGGKRLAEAANVDPSFFDVLGVPVGRLKEDEVFVSYDFWRHELHGDRNRVGRLVTIDGRPLRVAGVLPRKFTFLSEPIAIWTSHPVPVPSVDPRRRYLNLRGVVARLNPARPPKPHAVNCGSSRPKPASRGLISKCKRRRLKNSSIARFRSYAGDLVTCSARCLRGQPCASSWTAAAGSPASDAARYWGFFAVQDRAAADRAVLRDPGTHRRRARSGLTGGDPNRGGPLLLWASFASGVVILIWAFRDQPGRCRVCLHRMRQPVRIGVPGQMLLEAAGEEVMCPQGHGSVYHVGIRAGRRYFRSMDEAGSRTGRRRVERRRGEIPARSKSVILMTSTGRRDDRPDQSVQISSVDSAKILRGRLPVS